MSAFALSCSQLDRKTLTGGSRTLPVQLSTQSFPDATAAVIFPRIVHTVLQLPSSHYSPPPPLLSVCHTVQNGFSKESDILNLTFKFFVFKFPSNTQLLTRYASDQHALDSSVKPHTAVRTITSHREAATHRPDHRVQKYSVTRPCL